MSVTLTVTSSPALAVVGGPIKVTVVTANEGDADAQVPAITAESPYEFSLVDAGTGDGRYALSAYAARSGRNQDSAPAPRPSFSALAPGDALPRDFDLGALALEPIAPGDYLLSVAWFSPAGAIESPRVPLAVREPSVISLAAGWCAGDDALTLCVAHALPDGRTAVDQRSGSSADPLRGVLFPRDAFPSGDRPVMAATAVSLFHAQESRWYAALVDGAVAAGVAQRAVIAKRLAPAPIQLARASLYELGWQTDRQSAFFLLGGFDGDGQLVLAVASCHARSPAPSVTVFPTGVRAAPAAWCARGSLRDEGRVLDVVLAFTSAEGTSLYRYTLWPDTGTLQGPAPITTHPEPVAALAMDPVGSERPEVVDVLFGPVGVDGRMTLARVALDASSTVALWRFVAPYHPERERPAAWALAQAAMDEPLVLAHLAPSVYALRVGDGAAWSEVVSGRSRLGFLHAVTPAGYAPIAIWASPDGGVEVHPVEV